MISLVFCGDIKYCPYLKRYTERLDLLNVEYEVLFWNRDNRDIPKKNHYYYYSKQSSENLGHFKKLIDFEGFRKWTINHLNQVECDGLILLSTLSGILLADYLHKFKDRYIFDIRDYSYEHISLFRAIQYRVITDSFFTAISSKGFKAFLPDNEYVIAHNFDRREIIPDIHYSKPNGVINFVWNGTVRYFSFQKQYIDALANDKRFHMYYHGSGQELNSFLAYATSANIKNITFTGSYNNADKAELLSNASLINNCYGGNYGDALKYAVSNRYYDGLIYRVPQLVEPNGYKATLVRQNGVGVPIVPGADFADWLYDYVMNIDPFEFECRCEKAINSILIEDDNYISQIDCFIRKMR